MGSPGGPQIGLGAGGCQAPSVYKLPSPRCRAPPHPVPRPPHFLGVFPLCVCSLVHLFVFQCIDSLKCIHFHPCSK